MLRGAAAGVFGAGIAVLAACGDDTGPRGGGGSGGGGGQGGEAEAAPLVVATDKGDVEGVLVESTRAFLGVPYAAPPTGDARWTPPVPHAAWDETLAAKEKGAPCAQLQLLDTVYDDRTIEDCLTLNVWTPERPGDEPLPVMVWIHGGAFVLGSGSDAPYDGRVLSESTHAVVVAINYRLGPLGFLALPELEAEDAAYPSSGNYGFEDQRAALQWVKANIAAFGGDPSRVAVFGESAGGISTCLHMVSPGSEGLFASTMIQSGPCDTLTTEADAHAQGLALVEAVGCDAEADVLACMRGKTTAEIIDAIPAGTDFLSPGAPNWAPVLDGLVFPDQPAALFEEGQFADVPAIVGANANEASLFFTLSELMVPDEESFLALAESLVPGHGQDVVAQYPADRLGSAQAAAIAAVGDAGFVCPARRTARRIANAGGEAYLYHFTYGPQSLFGELGAFHSAEIKFVLGVPSQLLPFTITAEEQPLVDAMMGYWYRHTASGDPNGEGAVLWPRYELEADEHLVLDLEVSTGSKLREELCDFWDGVTVSPP